MALQDQNQAPKRVCLGKIVAAHGIKGLVKIRPYGDDPSLLQNLSPLYTASNGIETLQIALKNALGKYWLAKIEGITDRTEAEKLRGTELYTEKSRLPAIENEDSFYYEDLVGLEVYNENDEKAGKVIAVDNFGAGDLLEIQPPGGASFYLPFKDEFIVSVDLDGKKISVRDIERIRIT